MKQGGNTRFNNLMGEYNIPLTPNNQKYKYYSNIADYYRKALQDEVQKGSSLLEKPDKKEGIRVIEEFNSIENKNIVEYNQNSKVNASSELNNPYLNINQVNMQNNYYPETKTLNQDFNMFMTSIGSFFHKVGNKFQNKIEEIGINDKIQNASEATRNFVDNSKDYLKDKTKGIEKSTFLRKVKTQTEKGIDIIKTTASALIDKAKKDNKNNENQNISEPLNQNVNNVNINVNIEGINETNKE